MKNNGKGRKLNQQMNKHNTLSILERGVYSDPPNYKPKFTSHSIMEIAVYNPIVHERNGIWKKISKKIKSFITKES